MVFPFVDLVRFITEWCSVCSSHRWQLGCSPTCECASTALFPVRFASSATSAMRLYQAVSSRRSWCLRLVARRRAWTLLPHRRAVRCSSMVTRVSSLIHWCFFLRRGPSTAWLVSFRAFLPSFQRFSMDVADSSDSGRSANRLCSFSTKLCCVVGSRSFSTAMGGLVKYLVAESSASGEVSRWLRVRPDGGQCCCRSLHSDTLGSSGRRSIELRR